MPLFRREQVIGIVSSWDIRRGKTGFSLLFFAHDETEGYSLLFTDTRVVGARREEYPDDFRAYLGPGSTASDELRARALATAENILAREDFELQKDNLVKIIYERPKAYIGGRLLFIQPGRRVELKVTLVSPFNPGILSTLDTLVRSLCAFAPDKFYDEETGRRFNGPQVRSISTG